MCAGILVGGWVRWWPGRRRCHPAVAVLKLAATVVAIALADCINPSLIGGELFVATGPRPRRRTAAYTAAAWTVTFVFGLALALGLGDLILSLVPKPSATVKYRLIEVAGVVLLIGGVVILLRRRTLVRADQTQRWAGSHQSSGAIGAGIAAVELLTAFPYFAAIAMIVGSGVSGASKLALLVLYCVVYALPLIAITAVFALKGDRAERILQPGSDWLSAHWPLVVGPITAAIGIGVVVFGILQLN